MQLFPSEMKMYDQWAVSGADKIPMVWDYAHNKLVRVDVNATSKLMPFSAALDCAKHFALNIGFVLTSTDPFCCIDLDVKDATNEANPAKWTSQAQLQRFAFIVNTFHSYAEYSRSGKGMHVWLYGDTGKGKRRDGVELYSRERYIVCTGHHYSETPRTIAGQGESAEYIKYYLEMLSNEIDAGRKDYNAPLLELEEPTGQNDVVDDNYLEDVELHMRACEADNGNKYQQLFEGRWAPRGNGTGPNEVHYGEPCYQSQSEADLALMSMYTFYTKYNAQCRRMFRASGLGKRDKAVKNDSYVNRTISICRGRQLREQVAMQQVETMAREFVDKMVAKREAAMPEPANVVIEGTAGEIHVPDTSYMSWPPGITGEIAKYIYQNSMRPVKEISIITSLAMMSGICGKAWHIPQSGLNGYYILIAQSGVGKETLHSGISNILDQLVTTMPGAGMFFDFNKYASGPALRKALVQDTKKSFVNINGEIGKMFQRMAGEGATGPMHSFKTDLTDIYQKSGPGNMIGGVTYSNAESNTQSVEGVAYSLVGETTPDSFYGALTREMMEDGFLSRFHIYEYKGLRPDLNTQPLRVLPDNLRNWLGQLITKAVTLLNRHDYYQVPFNEKAQAICDAFNRECDAQINDNTDEGIRQAWNRAHLKVLRLSAMLAVTDNWEQPVVRPEHAEWALNFVRNGMNNLLEKYINGCIGVDDIARLKLVKAVCVDYITKPTWKVQRPHLKKEGIITKADLQIRCAPRAAFSKHRAGATVALEQCLRELVDIGMLIPLNDATRVKFPDANGKTYMGKAFFINPDIADYLEE